jgi:hypothetical protein
MTRRKREPRTPTTAGLPATFQEGAALMFARDFIAVVRRSNWCDLGDPFNPDAMHTLVRRTLKSLAAWHPRNAARIVEFAIHGMAEADQALRDLIAERNDSGEPLGAALATYDAIISERPSVHRNPNCRPRQSFLANFVIVVLVLELRRRFSGLPLRRNPASRHPSVYSVAATALTEAGLPRGGEEAIRKIWDRYGPPVVPGYS